MTYEHAAKILAVEKIVRAGSAVVCSKCNEAALTIEGVDHQPWCAVGIVMKGAVYATNQKQVEEGSKPEHQNGDGGWQTPEAGDSNRVERGQEEKVNFNDPESYSKRCTMMDGEVNGFRIICDSTAGHSGFCIPWGSRQ